MAQEEKVGIETLQQVLAFGVKIGKEITADLADGKFTFAEALNLLPDFIALPDLISKKDAIIAEAKDLSLAEVDALVAGVGGVVTSADVLGTITDALNFVVAGKNLVERFTKKATA